MTLWSDLNTAGNYVLLVHVENFAYQKQWKDKGVSDIRKKVIGGMAVLSKRLVKIEMKGETRDQSICEALEQV